MEPVQMFATYYLYSFSEPPFSSPFLFGTSPFIHVYCHYKLQRGVESTTTLIQRSYARLTGVACPEPCKIYPFKSTCINIMVSLICIASCCPLLIEEGFRSTRKIDMGHIFS